MQGADSRTQDILAGALAGAVAGTLATYAMSAFQKLWGRAFPEPEASLDSLHPAERGWPESVQAVRQPGRRGPDDATVEAADRISRQVAGRGLDVEERAVAGPAMHYLFGAVAGAAYGALAEVAPPVTTGAGLPFGAAVWLAADEIALPLLGLTPPPGDSPPHRHLLSLSAHGVYGLATEALRRALRGG
jgi:putative membrane protein